MSTGRRRIYPECSRLVHDSGGPRERALPMSTGASGSLDGEVDEHDKMQPQDVPNAEERRRVLLAHAERRAKLAALSADAAEQERRSGARNPELYLPALEQRYRAGAQENR